ncbi:MAG: hypothetical protein QW189_08455 [Thermofilaceae archaeon]
MYRLINDYAGSEIPRRLDLELRGRDRVIYVEEKNVKTLSTTKLHVFKEMIIDIYLNVKRGVKVVWHFSEHGTGSIYRTIVHALSVFRVEYWVGSHIPPP